MSFILDALRKSERQRDKGLLPAQLDVPATHAVASRLPLVLGVVGTLLAVNVVVLLVVLLRPAGASRDARARPPAAAPASSAATTGMAAVPSGAPLATLPRGGATLERAAATVERPAAPAVRPLEAEVDEAAPGPVLEPPPLRAGARVTRAPADDDEPPAAVMRGTMAPATAGGAAGVRSLNELPPRATAGLPRLNLDLHVYSPDAAQRFVVLNGRRYREGDRLQEGPMLERVTPDGVVLNHRGQRFLLPHE